MPTTLTGAGRDGQRAAQRLVGAGLLMVAPTAAAGWADSSDLGAFQRPKRVGLVHAVANSSPRSRTQGAGLPAAAATSPAGAPWPCSGPRGSGWAATPAGTTRVQRGRRGQSKGRRAKGATGVDRHSRRRGRAQERLDAGSRWPASQWSWSQRRGSCMRWAPPAATTARLWTKAASSETAWSAHGTAADSGSPTGAWRAALPRPRSCPTT